MPAVRITQRGWRELSRYTYVERPYEEVWPWLAHHLWNSGNALPDGGRSIPLRVRPAGVDVSRPLRMKVGGVVTSCGRTSVAIRGVDAAHPHLFPELDGDLEVAPVPNAGLPFTQIGVVARYRPPFGALGAVGDRLIGREVADAALTGFIDELAEAAERERDPPGPLFGPAASIAPQPPDTAGLNRVVLTIGGLGVRRGGAVGASTALQAIPGVVAVSIEPWSGLTAVDYEPSVCTTDELLLAVERF